jgi:hypothetical protein
MRYDPAGRVDAEEWSQLDEGEQNSWWSNIAGGACGFQTCACTWACMCPWRSRFFAEGWRSQAGKQRSMPPSASCKGKHVSQGSPHHGLRNR